MKTQQQKNHQLKFAKPTPIDQIPGFGEVLSGKKTAKQAASEQYGTELGEFFRSIPGMKEIFSKGPLNQQQDTEPDCESDYLFKLHECHSAAFRSEVLVVLVGDLIAKKADPDRINAVLSEIESQAREIQTLAGTVY